MSNRVESEECGWTGEGGGQRKNKYMKDKDNRKG